MRLRPLTLALTLSTVCVISAFVIGHPDDPKAKDKQLRYEGPGYVQGDDIARLGQFDSEKVTLQSWISLTDIQNAGFGTHGAANDCWGYVDGEGREYAIIGLQNGTLFAEVTDPNNPVMIEMISSCSSSWRDIKTYQDHAYMVSECGNGIQIADLSDIGNGNVTLVDTVLEGGTEATHNVALCVETGFLYRCGGSSNGLRIYSLADPSSPVFVAEWNDKYVHDAQIFVMESGPYAGREIAVCSAGFNGGFSSTGISMVDVTDKSNIVVLTHYEYSSPGYSHQGWCSPDKQYYYHGDELDEQNNNHATKTRIVDMSDLTNLSEVGSIQSTNSAIDHNLYCDDTFIYQANYRSGLRIFDASDPLNPTEVAYFDTYPDDDSANFNGMWSNYPFLPSGNVICSDIERGLFILKPELGISVTPNTNVLHLGQSGDTVFTNDPTTYTLSNATSDALAYEVRLDQTNNMMTINGSTRPLSGTLSAGGSLDLQAALSRSAASLGNGTHTATVVFEDITSNLIQTRQHVLEIGTTGFDTAPGTDLVVGGPIGGPFTTTLDYVLTSTRPTPVNVSVQADDSWVTMNGSSSPTTFTLSGIGDTQTVTIGIGADANGLPNGLAESSVSFADTTAGVTLATRTVKLDVGRFSYASSDTPLPIEDNQTFESVLVVADAYCIGDVDLEVDINHSWIGDLTVQLESPEGTLVTLHDGAGGDADNIQTTYDDDSNPPQGPGTLADFNGESSAGNWILRISDSASADQGTLNSWTLKVAASGTNCPPSAFDQTLSTEQGTALQIALTGATGSGGNLDYIITTLPIDGSLSSKGTSINTVPYELVSNAVTYQPPNPQYSGTDTFTFSVREGATNSGDAEISITVGSAGVLLVDDDDNNPDVQSYYTNALDAMGVSYDIWNTNNSDDEPTSSELLGYKTVIWFTGAEFGGFAGPGPDGEAALGAFLDAGNCLLISSQDYLWDRGGSSSSPTPTSLMQNYLGVSAGSNDTGQTSVTPNGSLYEVLGTSDYSLDVPFSNYVDTLEPSANGEASFVSNGSNVATNQTGSNFTAVYMGFPLEAVSELQDRIDILQVVIDQCGTTQPNDCVGDFDGDLTVGISDFSLFLVAFGGSDPTFDLDDDGSVGLGDFSVFLVQFGITCSP